MEFTFDPSVGLVGTHTLTVLDGPEPGRCVVRHVLEGRPTGLGTTLRWTLVIRWLHDALIEDLLDNIARAVGHPPARPARWSVWVRVLMALPRPAGEPAPTSSPH